MPIVQNVTTKGSELVWKSPDGQRELYKVDFEFEGKPFSAKSYSTTIIAVGWTGDILIEERAGKQGPETFAKQAPKEDGGQGYQSQSGSSTPKSSSTYTPRDDSHIKAQWAIGQAMAGLKTDVMPDLSEVEALADDLFAMVDRVKSGHVNPATVQAPMDTVIDVTDEPINIESINNMFPKENTPWNKS